MFGHGGRPVQISLALSLQYYRVFFFRHRHGRQKKRHYSTLFGPSRPNRGQRAETGGGAITFGTLCHDANL